jgi:hypothetical protein
MAARSDVNRAPYGIGLGELGPIFCELLRLIAGWMRQRFLVVEHRREIAHVKPTTAGFALPKMLGLGWSANSPARDRPARERPLHARDRDIVTGRLDGAQDASIRFVGEQSQQSRILDVWLGESQSAISGGPLSLMTAPAGA